MREGESEGNPYYFVSKEKFLSMSDSLIGRVGIDSKFNNYYGTIAELDQEKINTIILSEEGLNDFLKSDYSVKCKYVIVGIRRKLDTLTPEELAVRNRDHDVMMEEMNVFSYTNNIFDVTKNSDNELVFVDVEEVCKLVLNIFLNK
jgi:guanylate kinase